MAIKIELQREAKPIFLRMAKEAGLGVRDLAEIACYNLIALWLKEHGQENPPGIFGPVPDPAPKPDHPLT